MPTPQNRVLFPVQEQTGEFTYVWGQKRTISLSKPSSMFGIAQNETLFRKPNPFEPFSSAATIDLLFTLESSYGQIPPHRWVVKSSEDIIGVTEPTCAYFVGNLYGAYLQAKLNKSQISLEHLGDSDTITLYIRNVGKSPATDIHIVGDTLQFDLPSTTIQPNQTIQATCSFQYNSPFFSHYKSSSPAITYKVDTKQFRITCRQPDGTISESDSIILPVYHRIFAPYSTLSCEVFHQDNKVPFFSEYATSSHSDKVIDYYRREFELPLPNPSFILSFSPLVPDITPTSLTIDPRNCSVIVNETEYSSFTTISSPSLPLQLNCTINPTEYLPFVFWHLYYEYASHSFAYSVITYSTKRPGVITLDPSTVSLQFDSPGSHSFSIPITATPSPFYSDITSPISLAGYYDQYIQIPSQNIFSGNINGTVHFPSPTSLTCYVGFHFQKFSRYKNYLPITLEVNS